MTSGSTTTGKGACGAFIVPILPPADGSHDFQPIRRSDTGIGVTAPGDDLPVSLDGDAFALEGERAHDVGHGGDGRVERTRCSVDGELHRYSVYLRIAMRRKSSCRSKRAQPAHTPRCSRRTSRCQEDKSASCCCEASRDASLQEMMWPSALRIRVMSRA